jgi:hypothetical protein
MSRRSPLREAERDEIVLRIKKIIYDEEAELSSLRAAVANLEAAIEFQRSGRCISELQFIITPVLPSASRTRSELFASKELSRLEPQGSNIEEMAGRLPSMMGIYHELGRVLRDTRQSLWQKNTPNWLL